MIAAMPAPVDRTDRQRLIALFDALDDLPDAQVCLWSYRHPFANEMARAWAATRGYQVEDYVADACHALYVWRDDELLFTVRLDTPSHMVRS